MINSFFVNNVYQPENNLTIMHLNIIGLRTKVTDVELFCNTHNIDILCFSETFLKTADIDSVQIDNFKNTSSYSRKNLSRGGVAIYTKHSITAIDLEWIKDFTIEKHFECCGIKVPELNFYVICLYRTPDSNFEIFIRCLELLLSKLSTRVRNCNNKVFLAGDFNINILEKNRKSESFKNLLKSFNLIPAISEPNLQELHHTQKHALIT